MRTKKKTAPAPAQPQFERVEIEATPNGFVIWTGSRERCSPALIVGSFESRRSLIAWLGERLVPR